MGLVGSRSVRLGLATSGSGSGPGWLGSSVWSGSGPGPPRVEFPLRPTRRRPFRLIEINTELEMRDCLQCFCIKFVSNLLRKSDTGDTD